MYGSGMDNLFVGVLIVGAAIGAALVGIAWAFVVYVWPWLKAWLHAVTA